ncbi:TOMM precursor leader peptide-binding protein [Actinomadura gamaensis]|uniref:TOMM leader peptide-binding protein n=1 Tax=Actinomadura gamaensis TaxID=1763541 RepID=A0ABV9TW77_9ACTN
MADGNARLRPGYTVVAHGPDSVELRTGLWRATTLTLVDDDRTGALFRLVKGLDGTVSPDGLARREGVPPDVVAALVRDLAAAGAIEEHPSSALDLYLEEVALTTDFRHEPRVRPVLLLGDPALTEPIGAAVEEALAGRSAGVHRADDATWKAITGATPSAFHDSVNLAELTGSLERWRGSFAIFAETAPNPLRYQAWNRVALELDIPWLHATVDGPFAFVGPTVLPGRSACYECLERRLLDGLRERAGYLKYKDALAEGAVSGVPAPVLAPVRTLLAGHAALHAVDLLLTGTSFTLDKVLSVHAPTSEIAYHDVLRHPGCPGCAPQPGRDGAALYTDPRAEG